MRGILLAGGAGTRLGSRTGGANKHLLEVAGRSMLDRGMDKLLAAGVDEILVVTGADHAGALGAALADWSGKLPWRLVPQDHPGGIGQALGLCAPHLEDPAERLAVLLADNLFSAPLGPLVDDWAAHGPAARIHWQSVPDPERYGVAVLDEAGRILRIVEKPASPCGSLAVTGIYLLPAEAAEVSRRCAPSPRGEVEIVSVLEHYLQGGRLDGRELPGWWIDAGTPDSIAAAEAFFSGEAQGGPSGGR